MSALRTQRSRDDEASIISGQSAAGYRAITMRIQASRAGVSLNALTAPECSQWSEQQQEGRQPGTGTAAVDDVATFLRNLRRWGGAATASDREMPDLAVLLAGAVAGDDGEGVGAIGQTGEGLR